MRQRMCGWALASVVLVGHFVAQASGQGTAAGTCTATDALDDAQGVGTCADYLAAGLSCASPLVPADAGTSFGLGGSYVGYCNKLCQFDFLDYPAIYGLNGEVALAWLGFPQNSQLVSDIGTAFGETSQTSAQAVAHLGPGLCAALIAAFPADYCPSMLNSEAAGNHISLLSINYGLCDFQCPCVCNVDPTVCVPPPPPPPPPPLWGTCRTFDNYDALTSLTQCSQFIHGGQMSCSSDPAHQAISVNVGGTYAGLCNLACQFNRLEHTSLFNFGDGSSPTDVTSSIAAAYVVPWLQEMGTVANVSEAIAWMKPPSIVGNGTGAVYTPGLCELLITTLGYDRMCRGVASLSTPSGVYPGVLHPELCNSGSQSSGTTAAGAWDIPGSQYGVCEGLCDFACGDCQNTDPAMFVAPEAPSQTCDDGSCCSFNVSDNSSVMSYPGDNPICGDYSHLCGMIFAPDRGYNDCKTEGGMCCDIECGFCPPPSLAQVCDGVNCGINGTCASEGGAAVCNCDAGHIGDGCHFTVGQCNATHTEYQSECCGLAMLNATNQIEEGVYLSLVSRGENYYDDIMGSSECALLLASGTLTCHDNFAPGHDYFGYCDFACEFCQQIDPCSLINCGPFGNCTHGTCECDSEHIGKRCNFETETCLSTNDCCGTYPDFTTMNMNMGEYLGWGANLLDSVPGVTMSCSELITSGQRNCPDDFAPGRDYGGLCDFSCGYCLPTCNHVNYMNHLFNNISMNDNDRSVGFGACAADIATGWDECPEDRSADFYRLCRGSCGCASPPSWMDDGAGCLNPLADALKTSIGHVDLAGTFAVGACDPDGDATFTPQDCEIPACQSSLQNVMLILNDTCSSTNYPSLDLSILPSYPQRSAGFLADFWIIEEACDPASCANQYYRIQHDCGFVGGVDARVDRTACASTNCTAARQLLASSTGCRGMAADGSVNGIPSLSGINMRTYPLVADLHCSADCSTFEYDAACADIVFGTCTPGCKSAVDSLFATYDQCSAQWSSVYSVVYRSGTAVWLNALVATHRACGGGTGVAAALDPTETECVAALSAADTTCNAAGVDRLTGSRCDSIECVSTVNVVIGMHSTCSSVNAGVWPLVTAAVDQMAAISCPCVDHNLTLYQGLHENACTDLAVAGDCSRDIGAWIPSLAGRDISIASICCSSCSTASTPCVDQLECSTVFAPVVNLNPDAALSACGVSVASVFTPGATNLVPLSFSHYCPASCQSCIRSCQGAWSDWGECSSYCDGGVHNRTFTVEFPAENGGYQCEATDQEFQNRPCNMHVCPPIQHCLGNWTACSGDCQKTYTVIQLSDSNEFGRGGFGCAAADGAVDTCARGEDSCPFHLCADSTFSSNAGCEAGAESALSTVNIAGACGGESCLQSDCCAAPQACSDSSFRNDASCGAGGDTALSIVNSAGICSTMTCSQSDCCAAPQACADSSFGDDDGCAAGVDSARSHVNVDGTCNGIACEQAECCISPIAQLCVDSSFNSDSGCTAGADTTLTLTHMPGTCSGASCSQSECCVAPQTCADSSFHTDSNCAAGADAALMLYTSEGTCSGTACSQQECCIANTCTCSDGVVAIGVDCTANLSEMCISCDAGCSVDATDNSCNAVPCSSVGSAVGSSVVDGCTCAAGYSGTIAAAVGAPYFTGSCDAVPCATYDANSAGTAPDSCVCNTDYTGSIAAAAGSPYYTGQCVLSCVAATAFTFMPQGPCGTQSGVAGTEYTAATCADQTAQSTGTIVSGGTGNIACSDWDTQYHGSVTLSCLAGTATAEDNNCRLNNPCAASEDNCITEAQCVHTNPGVHTCDCPINQYGDGATGGFAYPGCSACPANSDSVAAVGAADQPSDCTCTSGYTVDLATASRAVSAASDTCVSIGCPVNSAAGAADAVGDAQLCACVDGYFGVVSFTASTNAYSACTACDVPTSADPTAVTCVESGNSRVTACLAGTFTHVVDKRASQTSDTCETNICTCSNGGAQTGSNCDVHDVENCATCESGYVLDNLNSDCDAVKACEDSSFATDTGCSAGGDSTLSIVNSASGRCGLSCEQADCCMVPEACADSSFATDSGCAAGADAARAVVNSAGGTCAGAACEQIECCLSPSAQLCVESSFNSDTACAAGDDAALSLFSQDGTCSGATCLESECCVAVQACSDSAFRNDAGCAAGAEAALSMMVSGGTCAGVSCEQTECCEAPAPEPEPEPDLCLDGSLTDGEDDVDCGGPCLACTPKPIHRLALEGSVSDISDMDAFEDAVRSDIAAACSVHTHNPISPNLVVIVSVTSGSILIDFYMNIASESDALDALYPFRVSSATTLVVGGFGVGAFQSAVAVHETGSTPAPAPGPTSSATPPAPAVVMPPPPPPEEESNLGVLIVLILLVLGGGGGAVAFFLFKERKADGDGDADPIDVETEESTTCNPLGTPSSQWKEHTDATTGKTYYVNTMTNETVWTKPVDVEEEDGMDLMNLMREVE